MFIHRVGDEEVVECLDAETGCRPLAVQIRHRLRGSLRLQQRSALEPGDRRRRASTRWAPKASCTASTSRRGRWCGSETFAPSTRCRRTSSARHRRRSSKARLLIVNVGAPGGPCVVGLDTATRQGSVARRQGVGAELRVAGARGRARAAARVRLRRRRVRSADRRADVDRSGERQGGLLVSRGAAAATSRSTRRARSSSTTRCSSRRAIAPAARCSRFSPDFTHKVLWTTQEFGLHFNTPIYRDGYPVRLRRPQRTRCLAGLRRCGDGQSCVARDSASGTRRSAAARQPVEHLSRIAARG